MLEDWWTQSANIWFVVRLTRFITSKVSWIFFMLVRSQNFWLQSAMCMCLYSTSQSLDRGGALTFVSPRWHSNFVSWGVDPFNQAVWTLFDFDGQPFGIVNIYASNHGPDRCALWRWLAFFLPQTIWLRCGDFNMIEKPNDKVGCLPMCWCDREMKLGIFWKTSLGWWTPMCVPLLKIFKILFGSLGQIFKLDKTKFWKGWTKQCLSIILVLFSTMLPVPPLLLWWFLATQFWIICPSFSM